MSTERIDTSVAHPARRYNYWLGGKDNFAADRASGDAIAAAWPSAPIAARENRRFLQRAVRYLAGEVGIRQFLDIGTGLPTADNTHEVAQAIAPQTRVVYVDNDPMVMVHARALLTSAPEGRTAYLEADLREPGRILAHPEVRSTLDFSRPIGLMLVAVLHFIHGEGAGLPIVRELLAALPPGSYLVASNATKDPSPPAVAALYDRMLAAGQTDIWPRDRAEFSALFEGLELVDPGVVLVNDWRSENEPPPRPTGAEVAVYGAVGMLGER
ncbi:SAM-dependent methyltransferase [Dactylosporangium sp. CS-033363]|uniref:SAM-dependent methyltransferase n=1 Tax=Dactylosporangium sp. CS-033363 TaxID=3239935 RepID=UPI003D936A15